MSRSTASKYGHFIIIIIVVLLGYSVVSTSVQWIEPTDLGLASKLPLTYWIGLSLLGGLWYIGRESRYCSIAALVLTVSYLYVAPTIIRAPPWISNSYYPFGEAVLVNLTGHLVDRSSALLVSYVDWPIFLYLASVFTQVTGISHAILLKYFPLLIVSMYGLLSVLILRTKLGFSYACLGAAWLLASFFIRQHYFGPQGIAYIFFLLILLFVSWLFFEKRTNNRTLIALLLFLCILTAFTHPLTSLMSLFAMFAVFLAYRLVLGKPSNRIFGLCVLLGVIWLGYNAHLAGSFFDLTVHRFSDILFGERELGLYSEPSRLIGSSAMQLNFISSWGIVLLGASVAAISMFYVFKSRRVAKTKTSKIEYSAFSMILLVLCGLFAFGGEYGVHEAYQRAFMFGLIPMSYLCISLLARKPRLLVVFLVGLLFLNIPAQYGGDTYRLATETQIAGTAFVADYTPQDISLIGKFSLYIRYHDPLKNLRVVSIGVSYPYSSYNSSAVEEAISEALNDADYIMLSSLQDNFYLFYLGLNPLEQITFEGKCDRIYDNDRLRVFRPTNTESQP